MSKQTYYHNSALLRGKMVYFPISFIGSMHRKNQGALGKNIKEQGAEKNERGTDKK